MVKKFEGMLVPGASRDHLMRMRYTPNTRLKIVSTCLR
jgi:hypothetical protein